MAESWSDPLEDAMRRASRPAWYDRLGWPLAFGLGLLLYTGAIAWSAYWLGRGDGEGSCITEPPAVVTRPSGRVP